MKLSIYFMVAFCILFILSCDDKATVTQEMQVEEIQNYAPSSDTLGLPVYSGQDHKDKIKDDKDDQRSQNINWDKKIIKEGTLRLEVEDLVKYTGMVRQLVTKWEAYISQEQEEKSDSKIENQLTIRIPVQYFDEAMQQLSTLKGKLISKHIQSKDVTNEYFDTRARMEAKKRVRLRYLDLLKQAKNMEDILQVEREVNAIQEQIEAGEGRVNYMNHATAYSTIHLTVYEVLNNSIISDGPPTFGKRILLAFADGAKWISDLLIFFITLWPFWVGLILAIWFFKRITATRVRA